MRAAERSSERAPLSHFERLYSQAVDPWNYATSGYEQNKYRATLDALPDRVSRGLELACSIGVFTEMLAARCNSLVGVDFSPTALAEAHRRLRAVEGVKIARAVLPEQTPSGPFDAIVCSELLYYWSPDTVRRGLRRIEGALAADGTVVAVHWLGRDDRRELDGDQVHRILRKTCKLHHSESKRGPGYLLDIWNRR